MSTFKQVLLLIGASFVGCLAALLVLFLITKAMGA